MASSSAANKVCFYCKSPTEEFFPGWRFPRGGCALLCQRCGAAFNDGTICDIFHPEASGYRECVSCNKKLHCSCIMAVHRYKLLNIGGVQCMECSANEALAQDGCSPMFFMPEATLEATNLPQKQPTGLEKMITVGKISDSCNHVAGVKLGADPIPSPGPVGTQSTPVAPQAQSSSEESAEESSRNLPVEKNGGRRRRVSNMLTVVQVRYSPETSPEELQEICRKSNSNLIPLFKKELTASDADSRNGRLVLPKRCAEAYFPDISGPQGMYLTLQDMEGKDWEVHYRYYLNSKGRKMYVLEGLKYFIILQEWEAGDTVTFFKREEDGKLFIVFRKSQATEPVLKGST